MSSQSVPISPNQTAMPDLEFLHSLTATLGQPIMVGNTPRGQRMIVPAISGSFDGPRLNGRVMPGMSGDWLLVRPDGVGEINVRGTLETDDGAIIYVTFRGYLTNVSELLPRWAQGKKIAHWEYYLAVTPYYETGAPEYAWLQQTVAIGIGALIPGGVCYSIYAVK
jgi:hypothetical protein